MSNITISREAIVVDFIGSSQNIEDIIKETFKKNPFTMKRHPIVREEQMPVFVAFLYDLIIDMRTLPSQDEFVRAYMKKYYHHVSPNGLIYHALVYKTTNAYPSLVRDLHFYFKLIESEKFDDVLLSYAYDIEAKQDLVVTKQNKKLGLQLFSGNDSHIPLKKKQSNRRHVTLEYPDYYLPLFGSEVNAVNIGTEQNSFYVYSTSDVKTVYSKLQNSSTLMDQIDESTYMFPIEKKKPTVVENAKSLFKKIVNPINVELPLHSYIYIGKDKADNHEDFLKKLLKNGVRVEWISPHLIAESLVTLKNLRVHSWRDASKHDLKILDGKYSFKDATLLEQIGNESAFNFEQYKTEHAQTDKHLIVEAGAGSGKTETMISRIFYLLHMEYLKTLDDIVMITFTNEAADNMKSKLSKRLYELFLITGDTRYIGWSEQVPSMRIMTIPSFAKTLLQDFSTNLGLGSNFSIRTLTVVRRKIIADELDKYIRNNNLTFKELGENKEYELIKMVDSFWVQLEQKGITIEQHSKVSWGDIPSEKINKNYYYMFIKVLLECEKRFNELKLNNNTLTVNDLTQKINDIKKFLDLKHLRAPFKYLFVDEFQDTDDIQINLVKSLTELTSAQLFVVGDIKQSIYRFRGANYTAFDVLSKELGQKNIKRDYRLKKNYRTNGVLLNKLEDIFDTWRDDNDQILPLADNEGKFIENRLMPTISTNKYIEQYRFESIDDINKYDFSHKIQDLYKTLEKDDKSKSPVELAILVRTNYQAIEIRKILEKIREADRSFNYEIKTGGDLFASEAAKDLLILFNAMCYDDDPESYFALYQTPFTKKAFDLQRLLPHEGDKRKILAEELFDEIEGLEEARKGLRIKPTLHVIYEFLMTNRFENVLASSNKQLHDIQKYRLNLYRMLELAAEGNSVSAVSIYNLRYWLEVQIATNRNEDEMDVDITNCEKLVRVITVHKAKGLEFDTVFIPFTQSPFEKKPNQEMIVTKENDNFKAGWKLKVNVSRTESIVSPLYENLKEQEKKEIIREEARLLYVAMTRAKHRLYVLTQTPKYFKNNKYNWSDLIRLELGKK
ncbi:UvrD-helicase domain-containing protein [Fictibacillus aquaticus]|uniref:UvrD-helicase domain-containing protein n=1 Tax=Fictibacillus aquaticus TaxID=2021314 RepID=UPI0013FD2A12|nr:ATP-dependent helicase [Fictibacillus aquaticus]